jgi:hypothetical protein
MEPSVVDSPFDMMVPAVLATLFFAVHVCGGAEHPYEYEEGGRITLDAQHPYEYEEGGRITLDLSKVVWNVQLAAGGILPPPPPKPDCTFLNNTQLYDPGSKVREVCVCVCVCVCVRACVRMRACVRA